MSNRCAVAMERLSPGVMAALRSIRGATANLLSRCRPGVRLFPMQMVLLYATVTPFANAQVRTIYIPSGGSSGPALTAVKIPGVLNVTTSDGVVHVLEGPSLVGWKASTLNLNAEEISHAVVLTAGGTDLRSRKELLDKQDFYWIVLPISMVDRIVAKEKEGMYPELRVTLRDGIQGLPALLKPSYEGGSFEVRGTEDLKEFGKGHFSGMLGSYGKVQEIVFPASAPAPIPPKSALSASVTEVSGRRHDLTDFRVGNVLKLERGGSKVDVNVSTVAKIEYRDERNCTVTLKSGAQQNFVCLNGTMGGKAAEGWYEMVPPAALKTVEFK